MQHGTDCADEIDQHQFCAAAPDLQAKEERAFRIERHRDERLSDTAAHRLLARQQVVRLQHAHDDRDRLRRKPGHAGDIRLGETAMLAHQRQHHTLVVVAHTALVGAAAEAGSGSWGRSLVPVSTLVLPWDSRLLRGQWRYRAMLSIIIQSDLFIDRRHRSDVRFGRKATGREMSRGSGDCRRPVAGCSVSSLGGLS